MTVELPADLRPIVERAISTGNCSDEAEVVRRALRLYEQFEDRREALKREIEQGINSGESMPADIVFQELEQFAQQLSRRNAATQ